jgi:3-hydroxyisobutyrate dehydrogenase-like beta-hydroxyacid dehydrogenase
MKVALLGLGRMGAGIAANLLRAGHDLAVWNRSASKAQTLVAQGATLQATPKAAATGREVVFTMLADDAALHEVLSGPDGILQGLPRGALHVSLSTISVATAEQVAAAHAEHGQRYLSAPVFGRPEAAAAAKLYIVAAGPEADFKTASALFSAIGQRTFYLGASPALANLLKLCGNFTILAAIESFAEAMTLAEKGGIPRKQFLEVMTGSLFDLPVYRNYGGALAEDRFTPAGFAAPLGLKDMRLLGQSAETLRVPMPVLNVLKDHLLQTIGRDGEEVDWSAIGRTIARNAGLSAA